MTEEHTKRTGSACAATGPPIFVDEMWATNNSLAAVRAWAARWRASCRLGATVALAAAALGGVPHFAGPAQAQPPLIQAWVAFGADCHGGRPDAPKTVQACKKREQVGERLKRRGCVYQEDGDWWKCPH